MTDIWTSYFFIFFFFFLALLIPNEVGHSYMLSPVSSVLRILFLQSQQSQVSLNYISLSDPLSSSWSSFLYLAPPLHFHRIIFLHPDHMAIPSQECLSCLFHNWHNPHLSSDVFAPPSLPQWYSHQPSQHSQLCPLQLWLFLLSQCPSFCTI